MLVVVGAVALAVLAGLAFLLLGSTSTQLSGPIAQAATLSSSTPGYRMHMSIEMTSSALSAPITASGSGVVDLRDHATSMSLVMNLGNEPQVIQQLGSTTMRMDMIMDGAVMYVKLPSAVTAALSPSGRQWIKANLGKLAGVPGLSSLESNPTTSDPSHILQYLRSASDSIVDEGQEQVDGIQTTHYRAGLSLAQVTDSLPTADRSAAEHALSTLQQGMPTGEFPVDVWIDAHHFVRRVVMTLDLNLPNEPSMHESVTIDLSDYGPQPRPATPSSDQVLDIRSLGTAAGG